MKYKSQAPQQSITEGKVTEATIQLCCTFCTESHLKNSARGPQVSAIFIPCPSLPDERDLNEVHFYRLYLAIKSEVLGCIHFLSCIKLFPKSHANKNPNR